MLLMVYFLGTHLFSPSDENTSSEGGPPRLRATAQGVTEDEVLLGMSAPFSGPSRELGRALELGINTYFRSINDQGGIAGRKLRLVALDDGYEPARALANMQELDQQRKVFAILGNVGTATAEQTLPYALERQLIFFGPFTGAKFLRKEPPDRFVFNYRASYEDETAAIVRYLMDSRKVRPEQIAVFAQQDSYGDAGFRGVVRTLRKHGRDPDQIVRVSHARNSVQVDEAVQEILKHKEIRVVVMVSTYRPAARFIQQVKDGRRDMIFTNVSFVGSNSLAEELMQFGADYAEGVIVTQVVPSPEAQASAVLRFRELWRKYYPNERPGFVALEGYLTAALLVEGIRRAGENLTTDTLIDALESIRDLDLGLGAPLGFSPSDHQASDKVWGTVLGRQGRYQVLDLED
jgi:ABC-type branched-subunit amino acid transport system substrate-binding protein